VAIWTTLISVESCWARREYSPARAGLALLVQADWEASPGWAGASGLFWTAIWRVAASFSDRGGTQNFDLGGSFNAAASQSGWSDRILSETGRAWGRAVTARWLCSDSRGLGIRTMLSSCGR